MLIHSVAVAVAWFKTTIAPALNPKEAATVILNLAKNCGIQCAVLRGLVDH